MLALTGCASAPRGGAGPVADSVQVDVSGLPQTLLAGARLPQARSVAMANARTKGWSIREAHQNQVLLERPLPRESLQALGLGRDAVPPLAQVQTNLVERSDGVVVGLRSFIIKNPGGSGEERVDATANFHDDLLASLTSLQSAWATTRPQLAREMPRGSATAAAPSPENGIPGAERTAAVSDDVQVRAPTPEPAPAPAAAPTSAPASTIARAEPTTERRPATLAPLETRTVTPGAAGPLGPVQTAPQPLVAATPTPLPSAPEPAAPSAPMSAPVPAPVPAPGSPPTPQPGSPLAAPGLTAPAATTLPPLLSMPATPAPNDMLVLNANARKGLWAYYAEEHARRRGCAVGALGAVLLQEAATYELHEVHCDGSNNFLLRCQGGVCQETR
ncbi:MAG: hypothetical protein EA400_03810 [Chromatiaceae bacterium]|nr:MAG: hypothetical protein EA400_03810 [Chromatiaceae bacterium]